MKQLTEKECWEVIAQKATTINAAVALNSKDHPLLKHELVHLRDDVVMLNAATQALLNQREAA